jgi:hypothetical protein
MTDQEQLDKQRASDFLKCRWTVGGFGATALLGSLVFACFGWGEKIEAGGVKIYQAIALCTWTLLPPMWFWYEYTFLFPKAYPRADGDKLVSFKYQQDLSSRIWLAVVSVLVILYFWKDLGRS